MVCSHCKGVGHTYRRCPELTPEQRKQLFEEKKKKKEEKLKEKLAKEEQKKKDQELKNFTHYTFENRNEYEVVLYWGFSNSNQLTKFKYVGAFEKINFKCIKGLHRIVAIPVLEVIEQQTVVHGEFPAAKKKIEMKQGDPNIFVLFDFFMCSYPGLVIEVQKEYSPPKSELEQWKEVALKSHYLLTEISKITGSYDQQQKKVGRMNAEIILKASENLEPLFDMIQDIKIPETCTEVDKERAGIPSVLTNVT